MNVEVAFNCPSCDADGYEETFDESEVAGGVQVSIPCDECPAIILIDVDVCLQVSMREAAPT